MGHGSTTTAARGPVTRAVSLGSRVLRRVSLATLALARGVLDVAEDAADVAERVDDALDAPRPPVEIDLGEEGRQ